MEVRPAVPDDDPGIVEIYNRREPDEVPMTVDRYRSESGGSGVETQQERFVATRHGDFVGYGAFHWAWWTAQPGIYAIELRVDPSHSRRGAGTLLFERMRGLLAAHAAERLLCWIRDDAVDGRRFAAGHGFEETGQIVRECRLSVAEADTSALAGFEKRLAGEGIRIATLAELAPLSVPFLRTLQSLWASSGDGASDSEQLEGQFAAWLAQVLHGSGQSPDTHWVALDGDRPVGMTFLKQIAEGAYENDYTGVAHSHRRQGIATALKLRAISWARQNGGRWFCTNSDLRNVAMTTINTRLGYRPGILRREVALDLSKHAAHSTP